MKFLVAFLVCVGVMFITDVIAKVFSPHDLTWHNLIWWLSGAISVGIIVFLLHHMS